MVTPKVVFVPGRRFEGLKGYLLNPMFFLHLALLTLIILGIYFTLKHQVFLKAKYYKNVESPDDVVDDEEIDSSSSGGGVSSNEIKTGAWLIAPIVVAILLIGLVAFLRLYGTQSQRDMLSLMEAVRDELNTTTEESLARLHDIEGRVVEKKIQKSDKDEIREAVDKMVSTLIVHKPLVEMGPVRARNALAKRTQQLQDLLNEQDRELDREEAEVKNSMSENEEDVEEETKGKKGKTKLSPLRQALERIELKRKIVSTERVLVEKAKDVALRKAYLEEELRRFKAMKRTPGDEHIGDGFHDEFIVALDTYYKREAAYVLELKETLLKLEVELYAKTKVTGPKYVARDFDDIAKSYGPLPSFIAEVEKEEFYKNIKRDFENVMEKFKKASPRQVAGNQGRPGRTRRRRIGRRGQVKRGGTVKSKVKNR